MSRLEEILASEDRRVREFPVAGNKTFFAHAAVCPLPAAVANAVVEHAERASREGQFEHLHREAEIGARSLAAALIGSSPEEIAFVSSTSAGLSMVAQGLSWHSGDSVVVAAADFPSNLHPWLALRAQGVEVRIIERRADGTILVEDIEPHLDSTTRLVALSSAHFGIGTPIDVDAIGQYLHSRQILFCLDAIQTLGAHPTRIDHVDFLVADAHKWLLGPQGIGILYVGSRHWDTLRPVLLGWKSVASSKDYASLAQELSPSAKRYEPGSLNASGICGLHSALKLISDCGIEQVSRRIRMLRSRIESGLRTQGHHVLGREGEDGPTGIVSFRPRAEDLVELAKRLDAEGFVLSTRTDIAGSPCIRVAPHFYNTTEEVDRFLSRV
ncbi:MAG TPA: aminotransferase class V-fold PLP-dependent enzyme [Fibrobacteria bacterium]|nr:aminotransferase class V-fold PLP-dependent enzyme [Fibrobacteria bacterium]